MRRHYDGARSTGLVVSRSSDTGTTVPCQGSVRDRLGVLVTWAQGTTAFLAAFVNQGVHLRKAD